MKSPKGKEELTELNKISKKKMMNKTKKIKKTMKKIFINI